MSEQNNPIRTPQLAAPGAGVPFFQKLIFRYVVKPFVASRSEWTTSEQLFHKISGRILSEIENLSVKQLSTRILVPPQTGLEDSSRFWSIAMTLEHLVIVGETMCRGIVELSKERAPDILVDTAKVKPLGLMGPTESISEFKYFVSEDFKKFLLEIENKDSQITLLHPWFGPMTAKEWFWLLAVHQGLHLKQIREIKKRLPII